MQKSQLKTELCPPNCSVHYLFITLGKALVMMSMGTANLTLFEGLSRQVLD